MTTSFPPSAKCWKGNWPTYILSPRISWTTGCRAFRKSIFPLLSKILIGSTRRHNLSSSFPRISGPRTSSMPFGPRPSPTPTACAPPFRPHGAYYSRVNPENGVRVLLDAVAARAKAHPEPYAHWYIDGGQQAEHDAALTTVSYGALEPARAALLGRMRADIDRPGMGPEALRTHLAQLRPADLGLDKGGDEVLDRFRVKMLTEGSGTQIFSTTFAQWTAREALRRAQPLTLLVRFAPRQRQRPMNELLAATAESAELDPVGSLVDADMGAYYNWLNQQRLPGASQSSFLVWFEGQSQAVAIGRATPLGTTSTSAIDLAQILASLA